MEFCLTIFKRAFGDSDREAPVRIFETFHSWLESYVGLWGAWVIIFCGLIVFYWIIVNQAINKE